MFLNTKTSFLLGYLFVMFIFWIGLQVSHIKDLEINLIWGIGINFLPTFGGIFGIITARHWGNFKSAVGKSLIFISLGLLSWGAGNWIWSYYNFFLNSNVPYPSLADVGYIGALPLWTAGMYNLSKATGVKYGLKHRTGQLYLILLPIVSILISYYLLVTVARGGSITSGGGFLKVFFDFAYPTVDVVIITVSLLIYGLSLRYLGGRFKIPVLIILFGFLWMFFADFSFSYSTTLNTYYNGGPYDIIFVVALFLMSFGISSIDSGDV